QDPTGGGEIWKSDGTPAGTVRVKAITPPPGRFYSIEMWSAGGKLFFTALGEDEHAHALPATGLWTSDGTEAATTMLQYMGWGSGSLSTPIPRAGDLAVLKNDVVWLVYP